MYNITNQNSFEDNYSHGLLPQRNQKNLWYSDTSSRSDLSRFSLSSENRRILNKTQQFSFSIQPLPTKVPKNALVWTGQLGWDFPNSSVKNIFTNHLFNILYTWTDTQTKEICAYSICYFSATIAHIAYVFYHPQYSHHELPIRLTLQTIIDSHQQQLQYCYLGRFDPITKTGFYKRSLPGFEYFSHQKWVQYI